MHLCIILHQSARSNYPALDEFLKPREEKIDSSFSRSDYVKMSHVFVVVPGITRLQRGPNDNTYVRCESALDNNDSDNDNKNNNKNAYWCREMNLNALQLLGLFSMD